VTLRIYQVQYSFEAKFDEDSELAEYNGEIFENVLYLGANNIQEATYLATQYGGYDKEHGVFKNGYFDITSVIEVKGMNVINWPNEEVVDPFEIDNVPEDDLIHFTCTCGKEIICKDYWETIYCPSCNREVDRQNLVGNNGKYILVDIKTD
jgi:hypothetical protein